MQQHLLPGDRSFFLHFSVKLCIIIVRIIPRFGMRYTTLRGQAMESNKGIGINESKF
jgi:hypothetical protein